MTNKQWSVLDMAKVDAIIKSKNMSYTDVSSGVGMSNSFLSDCKRNGGKVKKGYVYSIAAYLNVGADDIVKKPEKAEHKESEKQDDSQIERLIKTQENIVDALNRLIEVLDYPKGGDRDGKD
jgi:transcriptional regulator with XRE-family HTH domain